MLDALHTSVFGFSLDSWLLGLVAGLFTYFFLSKKNSDSKRSNLLSHLLSDPQSAAYLPLSEPTRKVIRGLVLNTPIFMMVNLGVSIIMEVTPWSSLLIGLYIFLGVLVSCLTLEFLIALLVLIEKIWEGGLHGYDPRWRKAPLTNLVLWFGKAHDSERMVPSGIILLEQEDIDRLTGGFPLKNPVIGYRAREVTLGEASFWTILELIEKAPESTAK